MIVHRRAFLLSAGALLVAPPAHAAEPTPAAIVTAIYRRVSAGKGESGGTFVWYDPKARPRRFSKTMVALWAAAEAKTPKGDQGPISFEPVTNSQDPLVKAFAVTVEKQEASTATVAVTIAAKTGDVRTQPNTTLRYDFVHEAGRWKIDDIRGRIDTEWSLRDMLARYKG